MSQAYISAIRQKDGIQRWLVSFSQKETESISSTFRRQVLVSLKLTKQIDHAINAFKLAKKELDVFITELVKAKDAGAKHVVDTSWCEREDFSF